MGRSRLFFSPLGFGVGGQSYSNFLASTVLLLIKLPYLTKYALYYHSSYRDVVTKSCRFVNSSKPDEEVDLQLRSRRTGTWILLHKQEDLGGENKKRAVPPKLLKDWTA